MAIYIPTTMLTPQYTVVGSVAAVVSTKKGPGHIPPIPHPIPKQNAPNISFQSTGEFLGSKTLHPFKLVPLFLITLNVIKLTIRPQPKTNNSAGFQELFIWRKWRMLDLRDMPEIINPPANKNPTIKTTILSNSPPPKITPAMGKAIPRIKVMLAVRLWSIVVAAGVAGLPESGPKP